MSQTAYVQGPNPAFQGQLGDGNAAGRDITSRANEEASDVPFGIGVIPGTDFITQFLLPPSTGFIFLGVLIHNHQEDNRAFTLDGGLGTEVSGNILRKGRVWVLAEETIVPGTSAVFIRHTASGGSDQPGAFRTDADTATADAVTEGAEYLDYFAVAGLAHAATGLALVDLNLPV